jgi:protoporphyrinogen oxidase
MKGNRSVVIIGAGPAGLTAAYESAKQGIRPLVFEKENHIGGLARTEIYKGYRFDIGGHRFFTNIEAVERLWQEVLGEELLAVKRLSRIYYQGRFLNYPLNLGNTISNLGFTESLLILLSYLKAQLLPYRQEKTFERWVINRFGRRLYRMFFKTYTEKVWGISCTALQADWAAQRINGLSLRTVLSNLLFRTNRAKTLIDKFQYPRLGPGAMWDELQNRVERLGGQVHLNSDVIRLRQKGHVIQTILVKNDKGITEIPGNDFISAMPLGELIPRWDPQPPREVVEAAKKLRYRAIILVGLIINRETLFPDQWIYVHSPKAKVGRIQNFKNWSAAMLPDPAKTSLGMEYFCSEGDEIWSMSDARLLELAMNDLSLMGWTTLGAPREGLVFRQAKAYPVYDSGYQERLEIIHRFLSTIPNFQSVGRSGMHRYNNQDHSMYTAMLAVKNLFGEGHDLWSVNTESSCGGEPS